MPISWVDVELWHYAYHGKPLTPLWFWETYGPVSPIVAQYDGAKTCAVISAAKRVQSSNNAPSASTASHSTCIRGAATSF